MQVASFVEMTDQAVGPVLVVKGRKFVGSGKTRYEVLEYTPRERYSVRGYGVFVQKFNPETGEVTDWKKTKGFSLWVKA